jgi:hypothetical protein
MARKDDVKMLLNFLIELLKDEGYETNESEIVEVKKEEKKLLTETPKKDEGVEKILKVMKRVEDMDKFRKVGVKLVPENERDLIEDFKKDKKIIETHETETKGPNIVDTLKDSKRIMNSIESTLPYTPSTPPDELNRIEKNKNSEYSINQSKLGDIKNMAKIYTSHPEDK